MNRSPNAETSYAWNTQKLKVYVPGGLSIMNLLIATVWSSSGMKKITYNRAPNGYQVNGPKVAKFLHSIAFPFLFFFLLGNAIKRMQEFHFLMS